MRLEFHPEAELELVEAALHYELEVPGLGERLKLRSDVSRIFCLGIPRLGNRLMLNSGALSFLASLYAYLQCDLGGSPRRGGGTSESPTGLLAHED